MDPEKTSYYRTLWMVALLIILIVLFLARDIFNAVFVAHNPFQLFGSYGRSGFLNIFEIFILVVTAAYVIYRKNARLRDILPEPVEDPDLEDPGLEEPAIITQEQPGLFPTHVLNHVSAIFVSIFFIGTSYAFSRSISFTLAIIAIIVACYGIVRVRPPPGNAWGLVFSVTAIGVVFPAMFIGSYFIAPGISVESLSRRVITQPLPLLFALVFVAFFISMRIFKNGVPLFRPLTDKELEEPCEEEIVLRRPFEQVFGICRDSLRFLPNNRITKDDPIFGILAASASPGWGRVSSISFALERIDDAKTRVKISIASPVSSGKNEPRKRTWVNQKYMKILASYVRYQ
jgi:hypothetical protein